MRKALLWLLLFTLPLLGGEEHPKKITILGTGYVGLTMGAVLADWGYEVTCCDVVESKVESLKAGKVPFHEPGLEELVSADILSGKLLFTTDIPKAIQAADIIFITVGTPEKEDGSSDLSYLENAAMTISENLTEDKTVCIRSTIPIGTSRLMQNILQNKRPGISIVFNPEFLTEGSAIDSLLHSERIVLGGDSPSSREAVKKIYAPLLQNDTHCLETSLESAEAIKYASNVFLALKVAYINEFSRLCEAVGADVTEVAVGMGLDKRISPYFLKAGPGFGGSCFPKDTLSLLRQGEIAKIDLPIVRACLTSNAMQMQAMIEKLHKLVDPLKGKKIALLGLAFKANTDDIRASPAIPLIEEILSSGGVVSAYDRFAIPNMKSLFPDLEYTHSIEEALTDADALIILTDSAEFKTLELAIAKSLMRTPLLLDTRNLYDPLALNELGFTFENAGRKFIPF